MSTDIPIPHPYQPMAPKPHPTTPCRTHRCMFVAHRSAQRCANQAVRTGAERRHLLIRVGDRWARVCATHWGYAFMTGATSLEGHLAECA